MINFFTPVSETDMVSTCMVKWQRKKPSMNLQQWCCVKLSDARKTNLWISFDSHWEGQWQLCFIVLQTQKKYLFIWTSFVCIYLNVNTSRLVLVYYSLSDDLSPRMNHLWGVLFSKRNQIINFYGTGCKNTIWLFLSKNNDVIFFELIWHHKIGNFIQKQALYETAGKCNLEKSGI